MGLFKSQAREQEKRLPPGAVLGHRWGALTWQRGTVVGLDFGAGYLKLAQVRWLRQGPRLENFAVVPMAPGMVDEGLIARPAAVADLLQAVYDELGISQSHVGTAIGGPAILMRHLFLPQVSPEEMRDLMRYEAPQHLPIPEESLVYDFTPIPGATGAPENQSALFLAGTNKRLVESYLSVFSQSRLRPQAIELDAFAELRMLEYAGLVPDHAPPPFALIDLGEAGTRVSVFQFGVPVLTRTIPAGLRTLRTALADTIGSDAALAEEALRESGVEATPEMAIALEPWLREMLESVGRSLEFFLIQNRGVHLERLFLTGGGAMLPGMAEALANHLDRTVPSRPEAGFRVEPVGLDSFEINPEILPHVSPYGPMLTVALGSALREEAGG